MIFTLLSLRLAKKKIVNNAHMTPSIIIIGVPYCPNQSAIYKFKNVNLVLRTFFLLETNPHLTIL